jgi:hypothetical protein
MQRLRHPIRSIREPFGKAGLTVAILALVFAMVGGAWAAVGLNAKQKKEVTKIAKKYAGKPGAAGATGPAGLSGAKGDTGAKGAKGDKGDPGSSVTGTLIPTSSATCNNLGGTAYTSASGTENVCNGENGDNGSPWTVGGTLPVSTETGCPCTEKGVWSLSATAAGTPTLFTVLHIQLVPMSFNIPLGTAPTAHFVDLNAQNNNTVPPECTVGGVQGSFANPLANSGQLCVYLGADLTSNFSSSGISAFATGALLKASVTADTIANGSWAVTG